MAVIPVCFLVLVTVLDELPPLLLVVALSVSYILLIVCDWLASLLIIVALSAFFSNLVI